MPEIKPYGVKAHTFAHRPPADDCFITLLEGSIRSGKTFSFHPKILFQLLRYKVDGLKVIVGVSKQTIMDNLLRDLFEISGDENVKYNQQTGELKLFGVTWLVIGAKDEGSEKYLRGKTIGVAIVEEGTLIPETFFKQLIGRLSPRGARLYISTNPDSPYHYMKLFMEDQEKKHAEACALASQAGTPDPKPNLEVIHFDLDDNPNLAIETRRRYEQMYTGVFYQRFILGLWVIAEGAIYRDAFGDKARYADADRPVALYNAFAGRYVAVDYGTGNPTVFLDCYDDGRTVWVDQEYYWDSRAKGASGAIKQVAQKTDQEYADDFLDFVGAFVNPATGVRIIPRGLVAIVDPSAASFKLELVRRGVQVRDANNDVVPGIRTLASALKLGVIRVHERCTMTTKELQTYAWDEKAALKGDEKPIKQNDHAPDALRYFAHSVLKAARLV